MFLKNYILFLFSFLFFFTFSPQVYADNFDTSYKVTYAVTEDAKTKATLNISLKNTTSQFYASSYKLQVGFETIENVRASDPDGGITPKITKTEEGNVVELEFNKRVVGLGNVLPFTITFDTPDVAQKNGKIWEINIPGITNQEDFSAFTVTVAVPENFGKPTFIKPQTSGTDLTFTKSELGKSGISLAFGESQVYDFSLTYHLRNGNVFPVETEIALPPSTNYQEVALDSISPEPSKVRVDEEGNWMATYKLYPSQKVDVIAQGKAQLFLTPKKDPLPDALRAKYLEEKPYWQVNNEKIKKLAKDLKTPQAIYEYVLNTLSYDFTRVTSQKPRLGAVNVLQSPNSAVCLEFTDLFVALARAAGIPAREVNGFAYTENSKQRPLSLVKDILHAWPEYYDSEKQTWVMIDPTWGNTTGGVDYFTTLDFDHFTFVKKGLSSATPVPAGGYKYEGDENKKDVLVSFSKESFSYKSEAELLPNISSRFTAGFPMKGSVTIKNKGQVQLPATVLSVQSSHLAPASLQQLVGAVPPYGEVTIPLAFEKTGFFDNKRGNISITHGTSVKSQEVRVIPFYLSLTFLGGTIGVISAITILTIASRSGRLSLFRSRQKGLVRGEGE